MWLRLRTAARLCTVGSVIVLCCAKKILPPSPDRFAPSLQEVDTHSRNQVALVFDEPLSGAGLVPDSFVLVGPSGETLALRGVSLSTNGGEIDLWTPTQQASVYQLHGVVRDRAGNAARFRARFVGTTRRDTIPPRVTRVDPGPGATRQRRMITLRVTFSETIDTASLYEGSRIPGIKDSSAGTRSLDSLNPRILSYFFVPAAYDTQFKRVWAADWQSLAFGHSDSLPGGAIVYFLLLPRVTDLDGNRVKGPVYTYFTSDTALDAVSVKGRAALPGETTLTPSSSSVEKEPSVGMAGAVFFTESASVRTFTDSLKVVHTESLPVRTTGMAALLNDGSFATKVRKGEYEVVAVADTNADGLADLASSPAEFNTDAESLRLILAPESRPKPINAYRR